MRVPLRPGLVSMRVPLGWWALCEIWYLIICSIGVWQPWGSCVGGTRAFAMVLHLVGGKGSSAQPVLISKQA